MTDRIWRVGETTFARICAVAEHHGIDLRTRLTADNTALIRQEAVGALLSRPLASWTLSLALAEFRSGRVPNPEFLHQWRPRPARREAVDPTCVHPQQRWRVAEETFARLCLSATGAGIDLAAPVIPSDHQRILRHRLGGCSYSTLKLARTEYRQGRRPRPDGGDA